MTDPGAGFIRAVQAEEDMRFLRGPQSTRRGFLRRTVAAAIGGLVTANLRPAKAPAVTVNQPSEIQPSEIQLSDPASIYVVRKSFTLEFCAYETLVVTDLDPPRKPFKRSSRRSRVRARRRAQRASLLPLPSEA